MQQLETAEVKLEQKLAGMMSDLGTQLKQAEETQLPLKRKKRQAGDKKVPRSGENPMAAFSGPEFFKLLRSISSLRIAFDKLMEDYRVYKFNKEQEQADAEAKEDEKDEGEVDEGGDGDEGEVGEGEEEEE